MTSQTLLKSPLSCSCSLNAHPRFPSLTCLCGPPFFPHGNGCTDILPIEMLRMGICHFNFLSECLIHTAQSSPWMHLGLSCSFHQRAPYLSWWPGTYFWKPSRSPRTFYRLHIPSLPWTSSSLPNFSCFQRSAGGSFHPLVWFEEPCLYQQPSQRNETTHPLVCHKQRSAWAFQKWLFYLYLLVPRSTRCSSCSNFILSTLETGSPLNHHILLLWAFAHLEKSHFTFH